MRGNLSYGRRGFTYVDLIVLIIVVPLVLICMVQCSSRGVTRETANKVRCANNLRQIGQAMLIYAAAPENRGQFPRTVFGGGPTVGPVWGTGAEARDPFKPGGPQPNDVTAAVFLLLRRQAITSDLFICPSHKAAKKEDFAGGTRTAQDCSNFQDVRTSLSYSFANPYPNDVAVKNGYHFGNALSAEFPLAADRNPGISPADRDDVVRVTTTSGHKISLGNSYNHNKDGQIVLYADGHAMFEPHPFVGIQRDNIYTYRANSEDMTGSAGVVGSPYDANDSVLLPTDD